MVEGLRTLGITDSSVVVVHSSLRSFGSVDGGAATIAEALVTACGTVVVPSGTWDSTGVPAPPGSERPNNAARAAQNWPEFDVALDRATAFDPDLPIDKELGAIPEALRVGFEHVRGTHPLFSFQAVGPQATNVIAGERLDWPLGPIEVVADLDGVVLLLGVDHTVNTAIHLAEQRLGRSRFYRYAKLDAGVWMELPNIPGQSHRFDDLEPALRPRTRSVPIGDCTARVVKIQDVLRTATEAILSNPRALLCDDPECRCGAALAQRIAAMDSTS